MHSIRRSVQRGNTLLISLGTLLLFLGVCGLVVHYVWPEAPRSIAASPVKAHPSQQPQGTSGSPMAASTPMQQSPLNASWIGTWRGPTPGSHIVISPTELIVVRSGPRQRRGGGDEEKYMWTGKSEDASYQDIEGHFGYGKRSKSQSEILRDFESSMAQFKADPADFSISDPAQSVQAIMAIRPGNYRIVWSYSGGDCGFAEHLLDQDSLLKVSQCKYNHSIELYSRQK